MGMADEKKEKRVKDLIEKMQKDRGYGSAPKFYVAERDPDFMEAYNNLYNNGLGAGKVLPIKTRELVAIAILAYRGRDTGVYLHMKRAIEHGATKEELMEAVETMIIPGGGPSFDCGIRALMKIAEEEKTKK
jgi:AhpD family alkylhydroperoxidase